MHANARYATDGAKRDKDPAPQEKVPRSINGGDYQAFVALPVW
jgi:hypothetical protein